MLKSIRRAVSFLRQKQILHKLGVVVSVTVIGIACYVLYHMLRTIDTGEVVDAIRRIEPRQVALAALFVAAGYFTLTFYDLFAVRTIGRTDVPYRVTALAGVHLLFDRAQCRRQRLYRRRGALPDLFRLGIERDRRRQDLFSGRPDVLARQCRGARSRHRLSSGSGCRDRSVADLAEPAGGVRSFCSGWRPMWPGSGSSREGSAAGHGR